MKKMKIGDISTTYTNEKYYLVKVIDIDEENNIFHVSMYGPFDSVPENTPKNREKVFALHLPIQDLKADNILGNMPVTGQELKGYSEFLKITNFKKYVEINNLKVEDIANEANAEFALGNEKYEQQNFKDAIYHFSNALNIYPGFFEAADNRGLSRMAMGELNEAIKDFEFSTMVNPDSHIAYSCIGECYYHLKDFKKSKEYFLKSQEVKPDDEVTIDFLGRLEDLD